MSAKTPAGPDSHRQTITEARQARTQRCGREFSGKKLAELTVHHRDHNHDYNPPDGSNWELLCLYCHENEHTRHLEEDAHGGHGGSGAVEPDPGSTHRPFADLAALLEQQKKS